MLLRLTSLPLSGIRSLSVAKTVAGDLEKWELQGILTFLDPPRPDTKETIRRANEQGVNVKVTMLMTLLVLLLVLLVLLMLLVLTPSTPAPQDDHGRPDRHRQGDVPRHRHGRQHPDVRGHPGEDAVAAAVAAVAAPAAALLLLPGAAADVSAPIARTSSLGRTSRRTWARPSARASVSARS